MIRLRLPVFLIILALVPFFISLPAVAIAPPDRKDIEWLRNSPDLQERIDRANKWLEPLVHPETVTFTTIADVYRDNLTEHFGQTNTDRGFIERIDLNKDQILDERDFAELAFVATEPVKRVSSPASGKVEVIVLPIKFPDVGHAPTTTPAYIEDYLFSPDHYSAHTYYEEVSDGLLDFNGIVVTNPLMKDGYWMADKNKHDYNDSSLLEEILNKANKFYDFTQYDADGDSEVDGTVFMYAGANDNWGDFYWGWASYGSWVVDGVVVGPLMFVGENMLSPSLITHEYGHMMGLPDFYDYTYQSAGVGVFCMMAYGGSSYMSAWCRVRLGWDTPINIQIDQLGAPLAPRSADGPIYRVWHHGDAGPEYFLIEGINQAGMDWGAPGNGIAIYHCDDSIWGNNDWQHKQVDVEEADGLDQLDYIGSYGDQGDLYCEGGVQNFNSGTYPNSDSYGNWATAVKALNLSTTQGDLIIGVENPTPVDEIEPNNSWQDTGVKELPAPNDIIDGFVGFEGDISDFWEFTFDGPKVLDISVDSLNDLSDLSLVLYAKDGTTTIFSAVTRSSDESLRAYVDGPGTFYIEVGAEKFYAYYNLTVDVTDFGEPGEIRVLASSLCPQKIYDQSMGIPVFRLEILNNAGTMPLNFVQVFYEGSSPSIIGNVDLWLDNGDHIYGPGLDTKLNPEKTQSGANKFRAYAPGFAMGAYGELFVTVNLRDANQGDQFNLSIQSYKDFGFEAGVMPYDSFPIRSGSIELVDAPMPLCYVAAGDFLMGTDPEYDPYFDPARDDYTERPRHLHPTGDYYIGRYEVTCRQWIEFMDAGAYTNPDYWYYGWDWVVNNAVSIPANWPDFTNGPDYPDYPIGGVCWYEAMAYAKYIGGRLPTEAEWEKASRGTDGRVWSWGNVYDGSLYAIWPPTPVGSNPGSDSPYGACDMIGNRYEWVRDSFEWYAYSRYRDGNFSPPTDNEWHMTRGYPYDIWSGYEDTHMSRAAFHWPSWIEDRWLMVGFRVAFDPPA